MHTIFIPLDERPCNYEFPYMLAEGTELTVERPPLSILGLKKDRAILNSCGLGLKRRPKVQEALSSHWIPFYMEELFLRDFTNSRKMSLLEG